MTKSKIVLVFISILVVRWYFLPSALPKNWNSDSKIGYTTTVWDKPEYTDTQTIVRSGIWYISMLGYKEIIPGSRMRFEGIVEPKMVLGKVTQMKMKDPKIAIVGVRWSWLLVLGSWREKWVGVLQKTLPEPMASLAAGILLGVKAQMPQEFYQQLVSTGTLHIVAASGYNVSVVAAVLMKVAMMVVSRGMAVAIGVWGIVLYVLIAGGGASVVRAGMMGSLTLMAYYLGRPTEARRLLWVTAGMMLLFNPLYIADIGFQLSFGATMGLLYIGPWLQTLDNRIQTPVGVKGFLGSCLYPTLAATVATLPIILWHFGRVSLISPLVNILILPLVPLIMAMTAVILVGGQLVAWLTYPLLAYMVWVIGWFG